MVSSNINTKYEERPNGIQEFQTITSQQTVLELLFQRLQRQLEEKEEIRIAIRPAEWKEVIMSFLAQVLILNSD